MSCKMRKKSRSGGSETWRVVLRIIRSAKPIRWWLALACLLAVVVIEPVSTGVRKQLFVSPPVIFLSTKEDLV